MRQQTRTTVQPGTTGPVAGRVAASSKNPERDAAILDLARAGFDAHAIARRTGLGLKVVEGVCRRHADEIAGALPETAAPSVAIGPTRRDRRVGKSWFTRNELKVAPIPRAKLEPPKPSRFACLGDALMALDPCGCRWALEDAGGVWFCGGRQSRFTDLRSREERTSAYCAEHHARSVGRGTPSERRAVRPSDLAA